MNNTREYLIDITLGHIERDHGIGQLSLRSIAREAGCSHVNLYHYIHNLEELVWLCYCRCLDSYRDWCQEHIASRPAATHPLVAYVQAVIAFATEHEGLYRLLWTEKLASPPPDFALQTIARVSGEFVTMIGEWIEPDMATGTASSMADLFGSWLLGKMSFYVSGRFMGDRAAAASDIMAGATELVDMMSSRLARCPHTQP